MSYRSIVNPVASGVIYCKDGIKWYKEENDTM